MEEIEGILQIDTKIWFNDKERCRLRICGFTKDQIKDMRESKFIDITLMKPTDRLYKVSYMEAYISINKKE